MRSGAQRATLVAVTLAFAACGAKTGLRTPDAEVGRDAGTDSGTDAARNPCVEVPLDGGPIELPLDTQAELGRADVFFLVDVTGSMGEEIDQIRSRIQSRIVPGIHEAIPDSFIGIGYLADFPDSISMYGESGDVPFQLVQPVTDDVVAVQAAVDRLPLLNGADAPEAQVEALYQTATGEGLLPYVRASPGCPRGGLGYPCFRRDALSVILLFTDEVFHNGPTGAEPYDESLLGVSPHRYPDALAALDELHAKVIGFYSGPSGGGGHDDLERVARDTGAIGTNGSGLVYDIGQRGESLGTEVVNAVRTLANTVRFDVDAIAVDVPGDEIDATELVDSIRPLRAEPADGVASLDSTAFHVVVPGTRLVFLLTIRNDAIVPGPTPLIVPVRIVFRGDGRTRLGSRDIDLLIPAADGSGMCQLQ